MDKNLFFYELEGRGYIFQNKKWDEAKHRFEDDMLNMAWEMWSSAKHSVKAQAVPERFVLVERSKLLQIFGSAVAINTNPKTKINLLESDFIIGELKAMINEVSK